MATIRNRIQTVLDQIAHAADQAARDASEIELVAVSKTQPIERIVEALDAGHTVFGENRVQEAVEKFAGLEPGYGVDLHLIGHLQSNKARLVPGVFRWVDSIDSRKTAEAISRRTDQGSPPIRLLLQFDCSGEDTKSGYVNQAELIQDAMTINELPGVEVHGVMTIGPNTTDEAAIERAFQRTRDVYTALQERLGNEQVTTLSMGMSADFPIAIRCGSTQVRIGSAIFGPRA